MNKQSDQSDFKILQRGRGRVLLFRGYQFYRNTIYASKNSYWRCKHYKNENVRCKGYVTLSMKEDAIIKHGYHSCHSDEIQNDIDVLIDESINEAAEGREPAPKVYRKCMVRIKNKGLHIGNPKPIPTFSQKKFTIYRKIRKYVGTNKIRPATLSEVQVPSLFFDILLADYSDGDLRIIIFCSDEAQAHLRTVKIYFMDGTFEASPHPFTQLFVIHGDIGSTVEVTNVIPLAYVFMSHRSVKAYKIVFELMKSQIPEWDPNIIHIDYEQATIKALKSKFQNATLVGCYFHYYRNCLKRKAAIYKLTTRKHKYILRLCSVLALLPVESVDAGWQYIKSIEINLEDVNLNKFVKYFEKFWMRPDFVPMWSVNYDRHRTTNTAEGWNSKTNKLITKNPTMLQLLHIIKDDDTLADLKADQTKRFGNKILPKRRTRDIENDDFIREKQMALTIGDITAEIFINNVALFTCIF